MIKYLWNYLIIISELYKIYGGPTLFYGLENLNLKNMQINRLTTCETSMIKIALEEKEGKIKLKKRKVKLLCLHLQKSFYSFLKKKS